MDKFIKRGGILKYTFLSHTCSNKYPTLPAMKFSFANGCTDTEPWFSVVETGGLGDQTQQNRILGNARSFPFKKAKLHSMATTFQ